MVQIGTFDASTIDPRESFDPIEPGWYAAQAIGSEIRNVKEGDGRYLQITFELLESHHPGLKGRRVWERLNLWNHNEKAVEIAQRSLSGICRSVGLMTVTDSQALHLKPLAIKVKVRPAGNGYEPTNEISGYDALAARFGGGASSPAPTSAAKPATAKAAPPWQKK